MSTTTAARPHPLVDREAVIAGLRAIMEPGQVTEARLLDATTHADRFPQIHSGYYDYDHIEKLAEDLEKFTSFKAAFFIPNPIKPAIHARAYNRIRPPKKEPLTNDGNIERRRFLPVDVDPVRESGISSTDAEREAALARAEIIARDLALEGFPTPVFAESGNGAHLLYAVDLPADDGGIIERCLKALAKKYDDDAQHADPRVKVDQTTFSAAQPFKLYGSIARKGDSTADRPHRFSRVISAPDELVAVPLELLEAIAAEAAEQPAARKPANGTKKNINGHTLDVREWIQEYRLPVDGPEDWTPKGGGIGKKWTFPKCPWNDSHTNRSAFILQFPSGAVEAGCHHDGCTGKDWHSLRDIFQPGWDRKRNGNGKANKPRPRNQVEEALDQSPDGSQVFDPRNPLPIARDLREKIYHHRDCSRLWFTAGSFNEWDATTGRYKEAEKEGIRAEAYRHLEPAKKWVKIGDGMELVDFAPTRANVDNVYDALKAEAYTNAKAPAWLTDAKLPDARELLSAPNGIVHLHSDGPRLLRPATPLLFSYNAIDYPFDPAAPRPTNFLSFLDQLWKDDRQQIDTLQEFAGNFLTLDTRYQKILLLVGPPRGGKGTIGRVFSRLIGAANICAPTLSGLATNFGLQPLLTKQLAIISDARLSNRADQSIVTERLLSISGEDAITIDVKNSTAVTRKLAVRFLILSNELPRLSDASGALANRFIVLTLNNSFLGREDTGLIDRIYPEMPGILLWAIEGLRRLRARGHFIQPATAQEAIDEMKDLASPTAAFVREWCRVGAGVCVAVQDIYDASGAWNKERGNDRVATQQVFGRDLRAAVPGIKLSRPRTEDGRIREYEGIELTALAREIAAKVRAAREEQQGGSHHAGY